MTNKELIEQVRALHEMGATMVDVDSAVSLCDRLEAAEAEIESLGAKAYAAAMAASREREEVNKLKGLIRYLHGFVPRGKTIDAGKWAEIEKILGEG